MKIHPLRICMIGTWSAGEELPSELVKARYLRAKRIPTCPWLRALAENLARRDDVERVSILVDTREVSRPRQVRRGKLDLVFLPKIEPGQTDPFHLHIPARIRIRPWLRKLDPDIVHGFGTESGSGWLAAQSGYPNVVLIQGIVARLRNLLSWSRLRCRMAQWMEARAVRRTDGLIAENEWTRKWALEYRDAADVQVIPNVVSPEFLLAQSDYAQPTCVCIGTLSDIKNPQMVIRAFAAANLPHARLVMIGDGTLRENCRDLAIDLGLSRQVSFAGRLSRAEIVAHMRRARCFALGSRVDSSPNVIVEAMAMGLPVIAADGGGIPSMICHGTEGFVVAQNDSPAMGGYMRDLLQCGDLCRKMGEIGMKRVRTFNTPDAIGQDHIDWYRTILCKRQNMKGRQRL